MIENYNFNELVFQFAYDFGNFFVNKKQKGNPSEILYLKRCRILPRHH